MDVVTLGRPNNLKKEREKQESHVREGREKIGELTEEKNEGAHFAGRPNILHLLTPADLAYTHQSHDGCVFYGKALGKAELDIPQKQTPGNKQQQQQKKKTKQNKTKQNKQTNKLVYWQSGRTRAFTLLRNQ